MGYCADSGCKSHHAHWGHLKALFYQTPIRNPASRVGFVDAVAADGGKVGADHCMENSYERSNTPDEVLYYVEHFIRRSRDAVWMFGHAI